MNFVDEKYTRYKLCYSMINVFVYNLVDFKSKFLSDFSFLRSIDLTH